MTARRRSVLASTRAELVSIGKLESPLGSAALALAARLDDPDTAGSAMAAIAKELRTHLEALSVDATAVGDPLDELKARREARLKAVGT